ncbi:MAG: 16S rRNA (uracil(1498)-N(3))-methyltransferase [Pyrinomonadaceae bacterium]|nr:16S rRNA (uracil(1498)-N(3))-methyltransferase [Pyrinomonadaceae bacterium]
MMRRFFVPFSNKPPGRFSFDREETRHIQKVLRLTVGDEIHVFDGEGDEFRCVLEEFANRQAFGRILKQVEPKTPESTLELHLGISLIKGDKFDLVIQKSVELGVASLTPFVTRRSEVKVKNVVRKLDRWRKIIIEASKQCGRARLMQISEPDEFESFIKGADGSKVMFSERNGESFSSVDSGKIITALIGPEGGWDHSEIELARKNGFQIVTLGGGILRAETAAISITAILQNRFGDLK